LLRKTYRRERALPRSYKAIPSAIPSPFTSPERNLAFRTSKAPAALFQSSTGAKVPPPETKPTRAAVLPPRSRSASVS
jgi:hypothetical protein